MCKRAQNIYECIYTNIYIYVPNQAAHPSNAGNAQGIIVSL